MRKRKAEHPAAGKRIVSVCSPQRGSGVTLTAAALACILAEKDSASFLEAGTPYVFDAFGLGRKFLLSGFTDYFRAYGEGQPFRGPENLWHGVHWAVRPGGDEGFAPQTRLLSGDLLRVKRRGEQAGTLLLVPILMLFALTLVLVVAPALMQMQMT